MMDAARTRAWLTAAARLINANSGHLTALDTAIGDGDHGLNLRRGFEAVTAEATGDTPGAVLKAAGNALIDATGGASGPLYGTFFRRAAKALGDAPEVDDAVFAQALAAGLAGVQTLGGAAEGDKTMVDALAPAVTAFAAGGDAAAAAANGRDATESMTARKGRASYLGERSIGHIDPGAASAALLFQALCSVTTD
ncbi:dihydroxyacetone kinase subunit L [Actinorhabdospora filicis]|uniref:Dihydroxyacetone kinase subunit L n=1 Tax=Actinorhabdospora filicis TaxID=1785913 RepID=A0A9W6WCV7_9ACTN|nr:dihydroxyacetone kinase subunit DhaL [Actinorhabdospora filicis]GLZ80976.1 dihydroxyacetone kinase subunit L [Actinorhabdospora filicis]